MHFQSSDSSFLSHFHSHSGERSSRNSTATRRISSLLSANRIGKWLFSLDAVREPRSWQRTEPGGSDKSARRRTKCDYQGKEREVPNGWKEASLPRRENGKTASWKRCKADSILCSGDIRLVPCKTSSHLFFTLAARPPSSSIPPPPSSRSCDALDFLVRRLLYPRSRRTTITRPCYHHRRNHHRPQPRRAVLTSPPT